MATGYLGTNYTQDQINSVPFLMDTALSMINAENGGYLGIKKAGMIINSGMTNPVSFVESQLPQQVENYVLAKIYGQGQEQAPLSAIESASKYLTSNGVSVDSINSAINTGNTAAQDYATKANLQYQETLKETGGSGGFFNSLTDALSNPVTLLEIAAAASIPGAAEALAPSIAAGLGVSTATATAIAAGTLSAATQVAAGVPVQTAIQNAAVGSIVSTGTNEAANAIISNNPGSSVASVLSTPVPGAAAGSLSPVVSAVSQGLASGANAALTGQNVSQAIEKGAAIGGISSAAAQTVSSVNSPGTMSGTGLTVPTNALPQVSQFEDAPTSTEGLKLPSSVLTGETVAPAEPQAPGIQYTLSPTVFTPGGVDYGFTRATPTDTLTSTPQTTPGMSPEAQSALQSVFGFGLSTALAPKSPGLGAISASTTGVGSSGGSTGTTSSTTGGSPGGTELDPSTGKAPELAWGDKYSSLKEGLNV